MGGVPVKHHSKSKVGRRRSHLALRPVKIVPCLKCKSPMFPHKACAKCGYYSRSQSTKRKS
ncbi:MAG: 50S ribosomal protein L32 [Candidatus Colwellbacteria bacterium CG_4_9_14_0_2_um_filter_50_12]|uniref:Large ribosomal subunit protein bL32 n=1 Tax=Candidatus Colwellbacteria bacterium CG_4_9_14_0_2_um_filter_50_12 TaxID=1974538 RepID=A0A2M8G115_9BACT|nr:MAG: 50S ribosomal protein L32 [Candidatus Colwellbacteria bacterium CG_4_9_14_0_2_um_filter_50_12]